MFLRVLPANEYTQMESPTYVIFPIHCVIGTGRMITVKCICSHVKRRELPSLLQSLIWLIDAQKRFGGTRLAKRRPVSEVSTLS